MPGALLALALATAAPAVTPAVDSAAQRVVSTNLCTDQLLVELLPRRRIASLSHLVADPGISLLAATAPHRLDGIPLNHGLAEEILTLQPDQVVTSGYRATPTDALLRRVGRPVLSLPIANSLDEVRDRLRRLGHELGVARRAEQLVAAFDARLGRLRAAAGVGRRPRALYLQPNGYSAGRGSLADDIIEAAGLRNLGGELGLRGHGKVSLEQVLAADPELLIVDVRDAGFPSLATEFLSHPAVEALAARVPRVAIPPRLWLCGLPGSLDALATLSRARAALLAGEGGETIRSLVL